MAYMIETVRDKAGRWHWLLNGGKFSSYDSFGSEADAAEAAKEAVKMRKAADEASPVAPA